MRFSFTFVVLITTVVAAVSAGVYPVKTGSAGRTKGGSDGNTKSLNDNDDNRFHLQSADGQYAFGHVTENQGRAEMRTKDGTVTGYYSYVGGNGEVVYVNYIADKDGYRVVSNTGVPSASVTINGLVGNEKENSHSENDFQKVFSDFTKRIQNKIVAQQAGQKLVDPAVDKGQHLVEPEILYPTKETKPSKHNNERNQFPDWNRVKISTTQKPADEIKYNEGQQQQEIIINPNWDTVKITTQKSDITGHDNDGQESADNDWKSAITTTETVTKNIPLVPRQDQSQIPTNKGNSGTVVSEEHNIKEFTTEIYNFRDNTESTVTDEIEDNSSAIKPKVSILTDDQTMISNRDEPRQSTKNIIIQDNHDVPTTISGIKQFEESSTAVISESATDHHQVIKYNQENNKVLIETDMLTTIKPLEESVPTTVDPSYRNNFQTTLLPNADFTINEKMLITTMSSVYEPSIITTFQPEIKVDNEAGTSIGMQFVTEKNKESFEFRTLDPMDRIGTTISPISERSEGQAQEIIWPEIPQEPIPQVLVPLDPYAGHSQTKNSGVKIMNHMNLRLVRQNTESNKMNHTVSETVVTEMVTSTNNNTGISFDFPKYYITG